MNASRIAALELASADPAGLAAFYAAAFDAEMGGIALGPPDECAAGFALGAQCVRLRQVNAAQVRLAPVYATSFQHFAIVVTDMAAAMARLGGLSGWQAISCSGPVRLPHSSGGVTAFKFRDPDGHPLELLEFPRASTPAVWRAAQGVFAGIDHTAITVANTGRSIAFWQGLGFSVIGGSTNTGQEQADLDGLDLPCVEVTSLGLSDAPPHLELLCYKKPAGYADAREASDILASRIVLEGQGALARTTDPDGHRLVADRLP